MTSTIRVLLIHSQALLRACLKSLLSTAPDIALIADVSNLDAASQVVTRAQADIVLLDLDGGADDWRELLARLNAASSNARLVLLTTARDGVKAAESVEHGVRGVVHTDQSPEMLFKALRKVHAGEVWLERSSFVALIERRRSREVSPEQARIRSLTKREREIVTEVGAGLKNREVGDRLAISEATVRNHLTSILDKLGLRDRTELMVFGLRYGLVPCPSCARVHDLQERIADTPETRTTRLARAFKSRPAPPKTVSVR